MFIYVLRFFLLRCMHSFPQLMPVTLAPGLPFFLDVGHAVGLATLCHRAGGGGKMAHMFGGRCGLYQPAGCSAD